MLDLLAHLRIHRFAGVIGFITCWLLFLCWDGARASDQHAIGDGGRVGLHHSYRGGGVRGRDGARIGLFQDLGDRFLCFHEREDRSSKSSMDSCRVELVGRWMTVGPCYRVAVRDNIAYVLDDGQLELLDCSIPSSPVFLGRAPLYHRGVGIAVSGNYAYVANEVYGLRVINVEDHANPTVVGTYYPGQGNFFDVTISGNYAYVVDAIAGLRVIDVSDPTNPVEVGFCVMHGIYNVALSGNYAYVTNAAAGLRVIDVGDPTNPVEVGFCDTRWATDVAISGNYAYVTGAGLQVIDVSDPTNPAEVGFCITGVEPQGVAVSGNYAYVGNSWDGLRVIDVSNPASPTEAGFYDTGNKALGVAVSGNYVYVADRDDGLYILYFMEPVPVMLQTFSVFAHSDDVRIIWEVAGTVDITSYRLYRTRFGETPGVIPYASVQATGQKRYEFHDRQIMGDETYRYKLSAVLKDGTEKLLGEREVTVPAPASLFLGQNFPNPFNPNTEIEVRLPEVAEVELSIYDMQGRLVARIFSGLETPGVKLYEWNGLSDRGEPVPSGVYVYRFRAGKRTLSRKMVLIR